MNLHTSELFYVIMVKYRQNTKSNLHYPHTALPASPWPKTYFENYTLGQKLIVIKRLQN